MIVNSTPHYYFDTLYFSGAALCDIHGVDTISMASQIDAFLSNDEASELTLENFGKFESSVSKSAKVIIL